MFNITEGEERQLAFFLILFACLGTGMAIGRGSADALFLKRYGVDYLPVMYITLSVTLAVVSMFYAAFVDRISSDKFFKIMLLTQAAILMLFWLIINLTHLDEIFPAYYLLYEIISEVMLVHAAFYIDQNLNTMQSKRLTPLIFAGYQTGMIIGGIILASAIPLMGVQHSPLIWAGFITLSFSVLLVWHRVKGVSAFYYPPSKNKRGNFSNAISEVRQGIGFIKQTALLRDASFALFFMVIAFYVLTFSISSIYTNEFDSEAELTAFFGMLVAGTNMFALCLQIFVSSRVIEKIGVRKTKLIFPLTLLASFFALIVNPGFYAGIAASITKDTIMPAFRNPSRQMFFNVLPTYMKGRARASAVVIVLPLALIVCGTLILLLQHTSMLAVYFLGLVCSLLYFYYCYRMGKNYIRTLIDNMKERLFIPEGSAVDEYRGDNREVYQSLLNGLNSDDNQVSLSYARLLERHYKGQAVDVIFDRVAYADAKTADQMLRLIRSHLDETHAIQLLTLSENKDDHFKATILSTIFNNRGDDYLPLIKNSLNSNSARVRATAIIAVFNSNISELHDTAEQLWLELIDGEETHQLIALELISLLRSQPNKQDIIINHYKHHIENLLSYDDDKIKNKVYRSLNNWQYGKPPNFKQTLLRDTSHHDHRVRSSAVSCLFLIDPVDKITPHLLNALDDGHMSVRESAHTALSKISANPQVHYLDWIMQNTGTPRAQTEIVKKIIAHGNDHDVYTQIIEIKTQYALKLAEAIEVLKSVDNRDELSLIFITLTERLSQIIDLILLTLQPLTQSDIISVIRAGFNSRDHIHMANAQEALQGIQDKKMVQLLNTLMHKNNSITHRTKDPSSSLSKTRDVMLWCTSINDQWLQLCAQHALNLIHMDQKA